ncbi:hypothetical protein NO1_0546 [Candidatus Termititenax aidoneus]|uniref:Large polyvalent protein-associated domain-containing protein n=1 Tax=Termititenax aidoneus TaxID=2218524 RepID=A0A388T9Q4_TERA1|nr:hypothetical protein NO1_0546 [Candidatus Termititenax aidoneus]
MQNFNIVEKIKNLKPLKVAEQELLMEDAWEIYTRIGTIQNENTGQNATFVNNAFDKIIRHTGFDLRIIRKLAVAYQKAILAWTEPVNKSHKEHPNFVGYSNYVSKIFFTDKQKNVKIYYIRFTLQNLKTKLKTEQRSQFHSAYVSNVELYKEDASAIFPALAVRRGAEASLDKRLAQFFDKSREITKGVQT